ncbi:mechanosensitive ion channel family protein [Snodgrassella gandavensis]|uniref:mechanosensitive ion channel family protein n=1 Tax=Snodgrassella gandavensis TaxID=2946698 RepID=UPI001EF3D9EE|nr:mechanosensitive ion channel domain-containing protein [Snodgrassella gandavensis]
MNNYFDSMFARKEFLARLIVHSLKTTSGWLELACAVMIMLGTYWLSLKILSVVSRHTQQQKSIQFPMLHHLFSRLLWPILLFISTIIAIVVWRDSTGESVLWLQITVFAARWLLMIRIIMAILHNAIPNNLFNDYYERSLSTFLWVCFVLWLTSLDTFIIRLLKSLALPVGSTSLSLYTVITGSIIVGIAIIIAMWLSRITEQRILKAEKLDVNLRYVLVKIIKTLLVVIAVLIALPMVGINLTILSVFGGALGVGLGLGLQKIASNYVSGFIILADHSVRPGDRLNINNFTGYVTKITARFVVLRSSDGSEALIPNDTFVSNTVINDSYSSKIMSTNLTMQVAYNTNLPQALEILKEAAAKQVRVCDDPKPNSFVTGFSDSGITLYVNYWIHDPENGFMSINSAILMEIWNRFKEVGIEFSFPKQEIRILNDAGDPIIYDTMPKPVNNVETKPTYPEPLPTELNVSSSYRSGQQTHHDQQ